MCHSSFPFWFFERACPTFHLSSVTLWWWTFLLCSFIFVIWLAFGQSTNTYHSEGRLVSKPAADSCIPITWVVSCDCLLLFETTEQNKVSSSYADNYQQPDNPVTTSFLLVSAVSYHRVGIRFPSCRKHNCYFGFFKIVSLNHCLRLSWQLIVWVAKGVLAHQGAHLLSLSNLAQHACSLFRKWDNFGMVLPWKTPSCSWAHT